MARTKVKSRPKLKLGLVPAILIILALGAVIWTMSSPSADVRRQSTTAAPAISSISPSSAKIGEVIAIRGRGFQPGTTQVYFGNGVATNYLANSTSTSLNIYVPDTVCRPPVRSTCNGIAIKAGTTYKVYVTDLQGRKSNEVSFTVKR
jgi:hypothetical protein